MMDFPENEDLSYSDGSKREDSLEKGSGEDALEIDSGEGAPEKNSGEDALEIDSGEDAGEDASIEVQRESSRKGGSAPIRILGLDYGSKTVGVALSDPLGLTAQPIETIKREQENKLRRTLARITQLCTQYGVTRIVLGLPKNMDNSLGTRAEWTLAFAEKLKARTGLPVELWDERLSTNQADRVLELSGVHKKDRKAHLDQMAAAIILQSYLDASIQ